MDTKFYYLRDNRSRPLITVCLATVPTGTHYRGISICSPKDNPIKRVGRQIALGRVLRAIHKRIDSDPIYRDEAFTIINQTGDQIGSHLKAEIDPILTPLEIKLLKNRKEKK